MTPPFLLNLIKMKKRILKLFTYSLIVFSSFQMKAQQEIPLPEVMPGMTSFELESTFEYADGTSPKAKIFFREGDGKAPGTPKLNKPFVIVEGIDFGTAHESIRNGDFGWRQLWGEDVENYPMMSNGGLMMEMLHEKGYDVIFVDFDNGSDDIKKNALVVMTLLQKIQQQNPKYPTKALGASMGGVVVRIALKLMENWNIPHCTSHYFSLDAPHQGANIPLGYQALMQYLAAAEGGEHTTNRNKFLGCLASKQLLINQFAEVNEEIHNEFQSYLDDLGFPEQTMNCAISNGSRFGHGQGFVPGNLIFEADVEPLISDIDVIATGNGLVLEYTKLGSNFSYSSTTAVPLDHVAGGQRFTGLQFTEEIEKAAEKAGKIVTANFGENNINNHAFIPATSALNISVHLSNSSLVDLVGSPSNPNLSWSPFDRYYAPNNNEEHAKVTSQNVSWILEVLEKEEQELPGSLNSAFNYSQLTTDKLISTDVLSGGVLGINANIPGLYNQSPEQGSSFNAETCDCETEIRINSGGKLQIGDSNGNKGVLKMMRFSKLDLKPGGVIEVHPNSKLIISKNSHAILNGTIVLKGNAQIIFEEGSNTEIHPSFQLNFNNQQGIISFGGKLKIHDNVNFQPSFSNQMGVIQFNSTDENIDWGVNSSFVLVGQSQTTTALIIDQDKMTFPEHMSEVRFEKVGVKVGSQGKVFLNSNVGLKLVTIDALSSSFDFVKVQGNLSNCSELIFTHSNNGMIIENGAINVLNSISFTYNYTGLQVISSGVNMGSFDFRNNYNSIYLNNFISGTKLYSGVISGSNGLGIEVENSSSKYLQIENTEITGCEYGISLNNSKLKLKCSKVADNGIGLHVSNYGYLFMSSLYDSGKNEIVDNRESIILDNGNVDINKGFNRIVCVDNILDSSNSQVVNAEIKGTSYRSSRQTMNVSYNNWPGQEGSFYSDFVRLTSNVEGNLIQSLSTIEVSFNGCKTSSRKSKNTTGISSYSSNLNIQVKEGVITIMDQTEDKLESIMLYNSVGQLLEKGNLTNNGYRFKHAKGICFVVITNSEGLRYTKKIILL